MSTVTLLVVLLFGILQATTPDLESCQQMGKQILLEAAKEGFHGYFMCISEDTDSEELLG